ncbi:DUF6602 domain-containing protein [Paraburkholderia sp. EG287A]|uniref:DUF6602 domain-containing protein n=1 Tax=Paraburkholderia sp. EG287A TaxID=3237012 RepID=UPI0034D336CB
MSNYFDFVSQELLVKLNQVKAFIKRHNPTIGLLTEEILRDFLRAHLPTIVSVEQGFIIKKSNELSRQCDIIIYDSLLFAPFYRINDVVVVPEEAVLAIIEVKTSITKKIFHDVIGYFSEFKEFHAIKKYLFMFNSIEIERLGEYFRTYKHPGEYQEFDHDTFFDLPDAITGINPSFHLEKDYVISDSDQMGYTSHFFDGMNGAEISALENFFLSVYLVVETHIGARFGQIKGSTERANDHIVHSQVRRSDYHSRTTQSIFAIPLFDM